MSVLDLPIEKQRECAKLCGYDSLEKWQEDTRESLKRADEFLEKISRKMTKAEVARKIHDLKTNPAAIEYYRRMTLKYDLTVEQQIAHLESVETAD